MSLSLVLLLLLRILHQGPHDEPEPSIATAGPHNEPEPSIATATP